MTNSAMAKSKHFHVRSISMQSTSHPLISKIEDELHMIKVSDGLNGLVDLYSSIEELLHLPSVLQALTHSAEKKWLEKDLEVSVKLLDLCSAIKDMLVTVEEQVQELQSALRRVGVSASAELLHFQVCSKKETRSSIKKCKNQVKRVERTCRSTDTSGDQSVVSKVLTEARDLTISLLGSVLLSLSMSGQKAKASRWSFVSKSMNLRKLASNVEQKTASTVGAYNICIKDVEAVLECLFRRLLQNRVSLLNILGL